jgi:serine/threonine-protein kinase
MELLSGATLHDIVRRAGRLDAAWVLELMDGVLDFCEGAHQRGIVHRDLKPANLYLSLDGRLRVLDLGIAKLPDLVAFGFETGTSALLGTPGYMPPEQASADWSRVDARSDIWAVGATAYQLLSGEMVHHASSAAELRELATVVPAPSLANIAGHLPTSIVELVDRALEFDPANRWPSAEEMRVRLHEIQNAPDELAPLVGGGTAGEDTSRQAATTATSTVREQAFTQVADSPRTRRLGSCATDNPDLSPDDETPPAGSGRRRVDHGSAAAKGDKPSNR